MPSSSSGPGGDSPPKVSSNQLLDAANAANSISSSKNGGGAQQAGAGKCAEGPSPDAAAALEQKVLESQAAYKHAMDAFKKLAYRFQAAKTVGSDDKRALSGWSAKQFNSAIGEEAREDYKRVHPDEMLEFFDTIGHPKTPHGRDKPHGKPGYFYASHAEKQAAYLYPNKPLGVSKEVCENCAQFLSKLANHSGEAQVITDPYDSGEEGGYRTWIFHPNGKIEQRLYRSDGTSHGRVSYRMSNPI